MEVRPHPAARIAGEPVLAAAGRVVGEEKMHGRADDHYGEREWERDASQAVADESNHTPARGERGPGEAGQKKEELHAEVVDREVDRVGDGVAGVVANRELRDSRRGVRQNAMRHQAEEHGDDTQVIEGDIAGRRGGLGGRGGHGNLDHLSLPLPGESVRVEASTG